MLQLWRAVSAIPAPCTSSRDLASAQVADESTPQFDSDRRQNPRYELELLLTVTAPDGTVYRGYSRNVSENGTAAYVDGELNVGDEIELSYKLPQNSCPVSIGAIIRHKIEFRYGVEFRPDYGVAERNGRGRLVACFPEHIALLRAELGLQHHGFSAADTN